MILALLFNATQLLVLVRAHSELTGKNARDASPTYASFTSDGPVGVSTNLFHPIDDNTQPYKQKQHAVVFYR